MRRWRRVGDGRCAEMAAPDPLPTIYEALGRTIAQWQHVETALYHIAHCALGTTDELSSLVFYRTQGARARIDLVSDMLQECRPSAHGMQWLPLRKRLNEAVEASNRLAHFEMFTDPRDGSVVLSELHHAIKSRRKETVVSYRATHIDIAAQEFLDLARDLMEFAERLFEPGAFPRKFRGQIPPRRPSNPR